MSKLQQKSMRKRRITSRYLLVATAWIAASLVVLQNPKFGTWGVLTEMVLIREAIKVFAVISIFSVASHLMTTILGLIGISRWAFGIIAPSLFLGVVAWVSLKFLGSVHNLGFWQNFFLGLMINIVGFPTVNLLFILVDPKDRGSLRSERCHPLSKQ